MPISLRKIAFSCTPCSGGGSGLMSRRRSLPMCKKPHGTEEISSIAGLFTLQAARGFPVSFGTAQGFTDEGKSPEKPLSHAICFANLLRRTISTSAANLQLPAEALFLQCVPSGMTGFLPSFLQPGGQNIGFAFTSQLP